jgi:pSer/pThr/pTyr-binding forkhead associated (FHA) protein
MQPIFALNGESSVVSAVVFKLALVDSIIGRSSKCDLVVRDATVSRRHAHLCVVAGSVTVADLDSSNGTFVNGSCIRGAQLHVGDQLRFGNVAFRLSTVCREWRNDTDESGSATERDVSGSRAVAAGLQKLSPAQRRVVNQLLKGLSEKLVATRLHLSITTVHNHIQAIYRILDVHSRSELLVRLLDK